MHVHARRLVVVALCLVLAGCASSAEFSASTTTPVTGPSVGQSSPEDDASSLPSAQPAPSGWTLLTDAPSGVEYHGVSCVASGRCWVAAVDQVLTGDAGNGFTEAGAPRAASLWGIDCPQDGSCYAVGATKDTIKPYLAVLREGKWTMVPLKYSGPQHNEAVLFSVSCPSPSSCWAAGDIQSDDLNSATLIVFHGSGTHWQQVAVPSLHTTMSQGNQEQITCPTVTFCLLTETYATAGGTPCRPHGCTSLAAGPRCPSRPGGSSPQPVAPRQGLARSSPHRCSTATPTRR